MKHTGLLALVVLIILAGCAQPQSNYSTVSLDPPSNQSPPNTGTAPEDGNNGGDPPPDGNESPPDGEQDPPEDGVSSPNTPTDPEPTVLESITINGQTYTISEQEVDAKFTKEASFLGDIIVSASNNVEIQVSDPEFNYQFTFKINTN